MNADELLASAAGVILDFDGPMAALMPPPYNREAADAVRAAVGEPLPPELAETTDHLAVLRHFVGQPAQLEAAHLAAERAEIECARRCEPAPWLGDLLAGLAMSCRRWSVATNNAPAAVETFLARHSYPPPVAIEGRDSTNVRRLKPDPYLVTRAAEVLGPPAEVVFVGDSQSDVIAGLSAGVRVLGYAKQEDRARVLLGAGALAVRLGRTGR